MTPPEAPRWQNLLAQSAPTFSAPATLPYGLATRVLAQLRVQRQQSEALERTGWRAIYASAALLLLTAAAAGGAAYLDRGDLEPGVRTLAQIPDLTRA